MPSRLALGARCNYNQRCWGSPVRQKKKHTGRLNESISHDHTRHVVIYEDRHTVTAMWMCSFRQAWRASTAALRRPPRTARPLSAAGRSGPAGRPRPGGGARTVTASAAPRLTRLAPRPPAARAGQGAGPGPRAPTPAGNQGPPPVGVTQTRRSTNKPTCHAQGCC